MPDEREDFIQSQQKYSDGRSNDRQDAMERRAISQLLTVYSFRGRRQQVFDKGLNWLWTEQYPDMPVPFIARDIKSWSFADLFKRFTKTPALEAFRDAQDTHDSAHVGAVFHAGGVGELIILNRPLDMISDFRGTAIVTSYNNEELYIQPYKEFLSWLVCSWRPMGGLLEA